MTPRTRARTEPQRCRTESGTAMLEFTLISVLLLTVVFGIINFGLILSFKQDLTRAAAEGARAAAVAYPASGAVAAGTTATQQAVQSFNKTCGVDGLITSTTPPNGCLVRQHDCSDPVPDTNDDPAILNCVQVDIIYDYADYPLLVAVPLIKPFLPSQIRATSDARLNT